MPEPSCDWVPLGPVSGSTCTGQYFRGLGSPLVNSPDHSARRYLLGASTRRPSAISDPGVLHAWRTVPVGGTKEERRRKNNKRKNSSRTLIGCSSPDFLRIIIVPLPFFLGRPTLESKRTAAGKHGVSGGSSQRNNQPARAVGII